MDSTYPGLHERLAEAHWELGQLDEARKHLQAELATGRDDAELLLDLGELLIEMDKLDEASGTLSKVLELDPNNKGAHFFLAEIAIRRNQPAVAQRELTSVLRIDRRFPGAHKRLARVLLDQGQGQHAVRHLLWELQQCEDTDVRSLRELGQMLLEARQFRYAADTFRRIVKLSCADATAFHNLAVSCLMLHRLDEGIRHCRRALKLRPGYFLAMYNLAMAHFQKGQLRRARRYLARATALSPNDKRLSALSGRLGKAGFWTDLRRRLKLAALKVITACH